MGKSLNEWVGCPLPVTRWQMILWDVWLLYDMNTPRKEDHYQMQTALEVRRTRLKNPEAAKLEHLRLPFHIKKTVRKTKEETAAEKDQEMKRKIDADIKGMIGKVGGEQAVTRRVISRKEHERQQEEAQRQYEERQRKKGQK